MSLLLEALQRASRDKEKALAASVAPARTELADELKLQDVPPVEASFPHLVHEPEPMPVAVQVAPAAVSTRVEPALELTLEAPAPTAEPASPVPPIASAAPLATLPREPSPPANTPPAPVAVPEKEPPRAAASVPKPASVPASAPELRAAPQVDQAQVAQDIRRAYGQKPLGSSHSRRRVLILGGVAAVLMLGLGALFLSGLGDSGSQLAAPSQVAGPVGAQAPEPLAAEPAASEPVTSESVPSAPEPAASPASTAKASTKTAPVGRPTTPQLKSAAPARMGVAAPPSGLASAPDAAPVASAKVALPKSPAGTEVALSETAAKPGVVARTRGPSPLENGYSALLEGRLDEAARLYGQALGDNPEERDALLGLAYIARQKGLRDEAQAYYRRVLRQEPGNTIASAALLGLDAELSASTSPRRAQELAARQPDSALALSTAGHALVRDGLLADAAQFFERAQRVEPANPLHAYNHAVALDRLGHSARAAVQYQRVLTLAEKAPPNAASAFSLETVRQRLDQLRQALATPAQSNP